MHRRTYLGTVTALAGSLAGCFGDRSGDGSDGNASENGTPSGDGHDTSDGEGAIRSTVRTYAEARDAGDYDALLAVTHPDGPEEATFEELGRDRTEELGAKYSVTIHSITVIERDGDTAYVDFEYTRTSDTGEETLVNEIQLRRTDGEWLIWYEGDGLAPSDP